MEQGIDAPPGQVAPLLEVRGIEKTFPGVRALSGVSFDVRPGEVHALLGENGAGKSTLIKIVSGVYQPDLGSILVNGKQVHFSSPDDARRAAETAAYFVLQAPSDDATDDDLESADEGFPEPMVIAETETAVETMTVSMAVLELDVTESQTIVFRNAAHGGLSVVYRRPDGNIGWIDPRRTRPEKAGADPGRANGSGQG